MKIEKTGKPIPAPATGEAGTRTPARVADNASPVGSSGTSVHLGSTTAQLRSIESGMAGTPLVDVKKVAEIKQAISEGRFKVNSGVVADQLISSVQDLLTASKH